MWGICWVTMMMVMMMMMMMMTGVLKSTGSVNMSLVVWVASGFFCMIGDKQKTQKEQPTNQTNTISDEH